jgi:hypothetical protein
MIDFIHNANATCTTCVQQAKPGRPTAQFKAVAAAVEAGDQMMLSILYGDWEGGQRVISQFALRRANDRWLTTTGRHFNVDRPDPR